MSQIDRASTFRGKVTDHAVSVTVGGFEQFECNLIATEIWDGEDQVWVNLTEVGIDANEIRAYIILRGKKGDTLSHTQVKKVFNWNGTSLQELNNGDYSETGIQFRVEEDTYENKTRLKVTWIDEHNAIPGRSVTQLSPDKLKEIDAIYQTRRGASGKKAAPIKAGGGKAGTVKVKGAKPTSPKGSVKKVEKKTATEAIAAASNINTPPDEVESKPDPTGSCTKQEAYNEIVATKDKKVADETVAVAWGNAIRQIGGGKKVEDLTNEEWFQVKVTVQDEVADIPF